MLRLGWDNQACYYSSKITALALIAPDQPPEFRKCEDNGTTKGVMSLFNLEPIGLVKDIEAQVLDICAQEAKLDDMSYLEESFKITPSAQALFQPKPQKTEIQASKKIACDIF